MYYAKTPYSTNGASIHSNCILSSLDLQATDITLAKCLNISYNCSVMKENDVPGHGTGGGETTNRIAEAAARDEFAYIFNTIDYLSGDGNTLELRTDPVDDRITYIEYFRRDKPIEDLEGERRIAIIWPTQQQGGADAIFALRYVEYDRESSMLEAPGPMVFYGIPMPELDNPTLFDRKNDVERVMNVIIDMLDKTDDGWLPYLLSPERAKKKLLKYRGDTTVKEPNNTEKFVMATTEVFKYQVPRPEPTSGVKAHLN